MIIDLNNHDAAIFYLQTKKLQYDNVSTIAQFVECGEKEMRMLLAKAQQQGLGKFIYPEVFGLSTKGKHYKGK